MQVDKVDKQVVAHSTFSLLRWRSSESRRRMVGSSLRQKKTFIGDQVRKQSTLAIPVNQRTMDQDLDLIKLQKSIQFRKKKIEHSRSLLPKPQPKGRQSPGRGWPCRIGRATSPATRPGWNPWSRHLRRHLSRE